MLERLALLSCLSLALAAPAHAGKRSQPDLDLGMWLDLATELQAAAASGNKLTSAEANAIVGQLWSNVNSTWLDPQPKRAGKKGKKGKKGRKGKAQSEGPTRVSASR